MKKINTKKIIVAVVLSVTFSLPTIRVVADTNIYSAINSWYEEAFDEMRGIWQSSAEQQVQKYQLDLVEAIRLHIEDSIQDIEWHLETQSLALEKELERLQQEEFDKIKEQHELENKQIEDDILSSTTSSALTLLTGDDIYDE